MWLLREISLPHFAGHAARSALTLIGIAIGVAAMVATLAVTDAVFRSFRRTVEATAGRAQLQISNGNVGLPNQLLSEVARLPGVTHVAPLLEGFVQLARAEDQTLALFGLDILAANPYESQLPRSAVDIPDVLLFANQPDSVALGRSFAASGYELGSSIEVLTPNGARALVVRGLVDDVGPASLFGGLVGLMDLEAAQRLFGREGRVDRIDVQITSDATIAEVKRAAEALVQGKGEVEERSVHGAKAEDLLFSLRVVLTLAGLIASVVAFFIIYHTVTVSVVQRHREIALLGALGVARWQILAWLAVEAIVLGLLAAVGGFVAGHALAHLSMSSFSAATSAWVRLPDEPITLSSRSVIVAAGAGLFTTFAATLFPAWSVVWQPATRFLHASHQTAASAQLGYVWLTVLLGAIGLLGVGTLLEFAPRHLPYTPLVSYIFGVNCLALVSFALLSPGAALGLGLLTRRLAARARGLSPLLASGEIIRNPAGGVAVIAAIVVGLGWILADVSLIVSFKQAWLQWLDEHYQSDLVVSAGGMTVSLLTYPPVSETVAREIQRIPGVHEVQAVRTVEMRFEDRPIVVQAIDPSERGLPLLDGKWYNVAKRFNRGAGIVLTENFAYKTGLGKGDTLELNTVLGARQFPILGVFTDFQGSGDLGGIAISRVTYRTLWRDELVSRIRVWLAPGANVGAIRGEIQRRFGRSHGLRAITFAEARAGVTGLIDGVFSITYAVAFIALTVSFVGVTNFLLSAALDRRTALRMLDAIGVSSAQIARAVVLEGWLLGIVGVILGLAAGYLVSRIIVVHSVPMVNGWHFDLVFPLSTAMLLCAGAIVLAAVAGLFPAVLATRRRVLAETQMDG